MQEKEKRNIIIAKWLTEVWGGIGEQKQSGNESQWRRIHFLVPASVGPSPLLSRLSLTRMMAHVYTHEPHARTYFWSGIRKEHSVKPRRSPRQFPRRGRGFFLLFFSLPPPRSLSLFLPLTRVSSCRGQEIFVFLFFYERGSLRTLSPKEPWSRTKDLTCVWFIRPSYLENYLAWIVIK